MSESKPGPSALPRKGWAPASGTSLPSFCKKDMCFGDLTSGDPVLSPELQEKAPGLQPSHVAEICPEEA